MLQTHTGQTRDCHLLEYGADSMIQVDDLTSKQWWPLPEEEVRGKHADESEVLLAAETHDGQGCLDTHGQILILGTLHT